MNGCQAELSADRGGGIREKVMADVVDYTMWLKSFS